MMSQVRSFTSFAFFFLSTSLAFWPMVLIALFSMAIIPIALYWDNDLLMNIEMLVTGIHLPEEDWMLIFMIPGFILGLPLLLAEFGGELMESQVEIYRRLIDFSFTPYGLMGWAVTIAFLGALFYWALWCSRQVVSLSDSAAGSYLAIVVAMLGTVAICI